MGQAVDPYAVLGVARSATSEQIRIARNELARKHHPDVNHSPRAAERFEEVQEAFRLLSDPEARARYDSTLDEQGRPRLVRDADGSYHVAGGDRAGHQPTEATHGLSVDPATVDFGVLNPERPRANYTVTITWSGKPPTFEKPTDGTWWKVGQSAGTDSYRMYLLSASYDDYVASAGVPAGTGHDHFTVTVDGTELTVQLSAVFERGPLPTSPEVRRKMAVANLKVRLAIAACAGLLLLILHLVVH